MTPADMTEPSREYSCGVCTWCRRQLPPGKRRDARTCSKACRQAAHRFRIGRAEQLGTERPMRFAYADPPYPGLARKYYACDEVDHAELVARLVADFPDGWALSTSSEALRDVLALCPPKVRVAAWVRGARPGKSYRPRSAWEPVIVAGGRSRREGVAEDLSDVLLWGGRQHSHPDALVGMKPAPFCEWMFRLLGACSGDALVDLFPGSGAVARAWELYVSAPSDTSAAAASDGSPAPGRDGSDGAGGDGSRLARAGRLPSRLAGAERRLAEAVAPRGEP